MTTTPDLATLAAPVTSDSADYKHTFFGILNAQGQFWTPLAFESEVKAVAHIDGFWADARSRALFRQKCQIVPVRIQLTVIEGETP